MFVLRLFISLLLVFAELCVAQRKSNVAYEQIRKEYVEMQDGDPAALPYVHLLINLAKKENNFSELTNAYQEVIRFETSASVKLRYADSTVSAAHHSCRNDLIAGAYLTRGTIHYFYYKSYQPALDDFIKAAPYATYSGDHYLRHDLLYHFGVVKSYMGLNDQAVCDFTACADFFRQELQKGLLPDVRKKLRKSYFNSVHQLANCYQQIGDDEKADFIITLGEQELGNDPDFKVLRSYFSKARGISEYRKGNDEASIAELNRALPALIQAEDFAWVSAVYFYLGKNALAQKRRKEGLAFFEKVDSVYQQHHFIFPELQENYRHLMDDAREKSLPDQLVSYADRLRDSEIMNNEDQHHLYERMMLASMKHDYETSTDRYRNFLFGAVFIFLLLAVYLLNNYLENKKEEAGIVVLAGGNFSRENLETEPLVKQSKQSLTPETRQTIRNNLHKFEERHDFLTSGLGLKKVAKLAGTNSNYLSQYLNSEKGMNMSRYLAELRISYIAKKISEDPAVAKLSAEQLCSLCGIVSASNLRHLFNTIHGMPLWQYQKEWREKFAGEMGEHDATS